MEIRTRVYVPPKSGLAKSCQNELFKTNPNFQEARVE